MALASPTPFGAELRRRREEAGMTRQALAAAARLSIYTVIHLECGRFMPSLESAFALAAALGTTVDELGRSRRLPAVPANGEAK